MNKNNKPYNLESDPLISVIVPVYNSEKYLSECMESIRKQTYKNLEIIVIDDGSKDGSLDILNKYAKLDNRIIVISKENSGVSDSRNKGIIHAKGKYICFVDSDDIISSNYIEYLYIPIKEKGVKLTKCAFNRFKDDDCFFDDACKYIISEVNEKVLVHDIIACVCGGLFNRELIDHIYFDTDLYVGEDLLFFCKALVQCDAIGIVDAVLYGYRQQMQSSCHGVYNEKRATELTAWERVERVFSNQSPMLKKRISAMFGWICYYTLVNMFESKYKDNKNLNKCKNILRKRFLYVVTDTRVHEFKLVDKAKYMFMCISPILCYKCRKYYKKRKYRLNNHGLLL